MSMVQYGEYDFDAFGEAIILYLKQTKHWTHWKHVKSHINSHTSHSPSRVRGKLDDMVDAGYLMKKGSAYKIP